MTLLPSFPMPVLSCAQASLPDAGSPAPIYQVSVGIQGRVPYPKGLRKCPLHTWLCLEVQEIAGKMGKGKKKRGVWAKNL